MPIPHCTAYNHAVKPIRFLNRHTGQIEQEAVYGECFLRWTYGSPAGALALHALVKRAAFSSWYGRRMNDPATKANIEPFIRKYGLDPAEFTIPPEQFSNFNEFFYRRLKPGARPIDADPDVAVFPADGRHLGFERASDIAGVFVKGQTFDLTALLGDAALADRYRNGTLVLSRLCPVDYHRFHFPVAGTPGASRLIPGPLFSVSPIALRRRLSYLWTNKRTVTLLESPDFGTVVLLEIGATCVGSILQTYQPGNPVQKGTEKGYFAFGGSSTITIFEPGRVRLESDLTAVSSQQTELYSRIGTPMARLA